LFAEKVNGTRADFLRFCDTEEALKQIVEMGFEQGITECMDQLDALFAAGKI